MPNRQAHLMVGILVLIVVWFFLSKLGLDIQNSLSYSFGIFLGCMIPDIIEPAIHYTHRKAFHSKRALKVMFYILLGSMLLGLFFNWLWFISFFALGYIVHLGMDATTPMGLPK